MSQTIAAVIPVFNGERTLGEAVDSVLAQTRAVDEVVIVDDGSTDATPAVIDRYHHDQRVRTVRQPNGGAAAARNAGVGLTGCDTVAFLDADDRWRPDKNAVQAAVLDGRPDVDAVWGLVVQFADETVAPGTARFDAAPTLGTLPSAMLIRRAALDRVGPFDETLSPAEWVDWYARSIQAALTCVTVDSVVAERRVHAANTGAVKASEQRRGYARALLAARRRRR